MQHPLEIICKFTRRNKICREVVQLEGASFYIGLYREIHLKPLNCSEPNLVASIFWDGD